MPSHNVDTIKMVVCDFVDLVDGACDCGSLLRLSVLFHSIPNFINKIISIIAGFNKSIEASFNRICTHCLVLNLNLNLNMNMII